MIQVEIWSDFVCPFCYIGKRNFEKAVAQLGNKDQVQVTFRSFELDPNAVTGEKGSIYEKLSKKYGKTLEWAQQANQQVTQTAKVVGLTYHMDQVVPANSFDAHRLSHLAKKEGKNDLIQELVMTAYFTEGKDISDHTVLKTIGVQAGLNESEIQAMLSSDDFKIEVRQDEEMARDIGVGGVPFFVFNRKFAVSGAQPPEAFIEAFDEVEL
jgi:predicted DsbA family dithiol-disulfide isomerase